MSSLISLSSKLTAQILSPGPITFNTSNPLSFPFITTNSLHHQIIASHGISTSKFNNFLPFYLSLFTSVLSLSKPTLLSKTKYLPFYPHPTLIQEEHGYNLTEKEQEG